MCIAILVLYISIATIVSIYQGYRGFKLQKILGIPVAKNDDPPGKKTMPTERDRNVLLCIADMFTYFICASTGFLSIAILCLILRHHHHNPAKLHDNAVLLIFLWLYGITGVTGKLPEALSKLKLS